MSTFLALPLEVRWQVYTYLIPSRPITVRSNDHKTFSHGGTSHPNMCNDLHLLDVCCQIRFEAAPLFFRSVYLGSACDLDKPSLQIMPLRPFYRLCVREAMFDIPGRSNGLLDLQRWLHDANHFPCLQTCKMVHEQGYRDNGTGPQLKIHTLNDIFKQAQVHTLSTGVQPPRPLKTQCIIFFVGVKRVRSIRGKGRRRRPFYEDICQAEVDPIACTVILDLLMLIEIHL